MIGIVFYSVQKPELDEMAPLNTLKSACAKAVCLLRKSHVFAIYMRKSALTTSFSSFILQFSHFKNKVHGMSDSNVRLIKLPMTEENACNN